MKIAIIGDLDIIKGFKALEVDVFGVNSKEEAQKILQMIYSNGNYALVLLMENWLIKLKDKIKQFEECPLPTLMVIPGIESKKSISEAELNRIIERAVGSNVLC